MPRAVCDKLDQTCWNFILGDTESTKKVHWVARKDLCKPKEKGEYWTAFGEAWNCVVMNGMNVAWRSSLDGNFKVKKAYYFVANLENSPNIMLFRILWR
ncbi:hypothetical protein JHK87_042811 [Glycine soja]|nr:hypothetical protein JHK87_042811 [Glycine soja]